MQLVQRMVQPARAVQCNGSSATGNERRCVQRVASASRSDSQATGTAESPGVMIALMVCSGPRPNECAVFEQKKRQGRDERRSLSGPQQLSRFESRESATVAGRAVSTTTRWAALLGREADARPELSVLAPTEIAQQTCVFRRSALYYAFTRYRVDPTSYYLLTSNSLIQVVSYMRLCTA